MRKAGIFKNQRLRLIIALPGFISLSMLVGGLLAFGLFENKAIFSDIFLLRHKETITVFFIGMISFALFGSLLAAWFVSSQMRRLILQAKNLVCVLEESSTEIKTGTEMAVLKRILDEVDVMLHKFIQEFIKDSHILDKLPTVEITLNMEGEIVGVNKRASTIFNLNPSQAIGKNIIHVIPRNEKTQFFYYLIEQGLQGRSTPPHQVLIPVASRKAQFFWTRIDPIRDEGESLKGITVILKDQLAIMAIRNQFQKLGRLADMGRMAAGIAHEVRNPLGSIRVFTELIEEDLPIDDPRRRYTAEILKQVSHLNHIVENILAFSRDRPKTITQVDISRLLSQAILSAKHRYPEKHIEVHENYHSPSPIIMGDPERLTQAFANFIINAFEASPEKGWIDIATGFKDDEPGDNRSICITITDHGNGIPLENIDKIFEPFFTTKHSGTGLGLSLSYHNIAAHGGKIEVHSQPNEGTTFCITFPEKPLEHTQFAAG